MDALAVQYTTDTATVGVKGGCVCVVWCVGECSWSDRERQVVEWAFNKWKSYQFTSLRVSTPRQATSVDHCATLLMHGACLSVYCEPVIIRYCSNPSFHTLYYLFIYYLLAG